ncbi:MAG: hypothetical protein JSS49_11190 [Planctomycetes bacterium]|nr:hypothetical protein [Planctomycetota bacterium]
MHTTEQLQREYDRLVQHGTVLAGGLTELAQRATVYHHLYEDSGRNHIFPLIAAHGALWARGYFSFGRNLGRALAWQFPFSTARRHEALAGLQSFADAFREINRRVCVDTYASYHFTAQFGNHPEAGRFVRPSLLQGLNGLHQANREGRQLSDAEKRTVFEAHFLNEQEHVVGPRVAQAIENFDWPLMQFLALRPLVRFAYFPHGTSFWFRHFDNAAERIQRGLRAFDLGARVGWRHVESTLRTYGVLPQAFFAGSARYFADLRSAVLTQGFAT